ncbi:hypothetical protein CDN99_05695 [Roseateles aquatilis]|uniref:DUF6869 domain-containing protein n=1 Tax=Roseateles aquatilis TaxID=431061 RepID=A0A246JH21_9BURK|nr:hypothetical protein [Roseateles aquatilis]OWQ91865.1 hypothetical protein CDN99_05695 [Roseateles aquatilis]
MALTEIDRTAWISAYIKAQSSPQPVIADHPCWWAIERFMDLDQLDSAEDAWSAILGVLERRPAARVLQLLAAGPLEDLIHYWGPHFIERIEETARENAQFRALLNGVWQSSTSDIWSRVRRAALGDCS